MIRKIIYTLFTITLLTGCQSAYYATMEKVGLHKRDILLDRVEETTAAQEEAKEEFQSALQQLSSLIQFDGGELQDQYELSQQHYDDSLAAATDVTNHIDKIEDVASALFEEWQDEIEEYSNKSLQRQSQQKLRDTERKYKSVISKMHRAEEKMAPVLSALKDNVLFLKHNLNAQAIGALKSEYKILKRDIELLIQEVNSSIENSRSFIETLKKS